MFHRPGRGPLGIHFSESRLVEGKPMVRSAPDPEGFRDFYDFHEPGELDWADLLPDADEDQDQNPTDNPA